MDKQLEWVWLGRLVDDVGRAALDQFLEAKHTVIEGNLPVGPGLKVVVLDGHSVDVEHSLADVLRIVDAHELDGDITKLQWFFRVWEVLRTIAAIVATFPTDIVAQRDNFANFLLQTHDPEVDCGHDLWALSRYHVPGGFSTKRLLHRRFDVTRINI